MPTDSLSWKSFAVCNNRLICLSGADGDIWCRLFLSPGPPASGILFTRWKPLISHSTGIANGGLPAPQALFLFVSPKNPLGRLLNFQTQRHAQMKTRSEEHTSELQSHHDLVCRLLL